MQKDLISDCFSDVNKSKRLLLASVDGYVPYDIDFWMEARLLRNKITHVYLPDEIRDIYQKIFDYSTIIFKTIDRIKNYLDKKILNKIDIHAGEK